ncbi:C40 family peptidase [Nocardia jiangxiensis]|uniref:C40 family peptidase n=1 Tax=Nocardia jiangxiensis TaxID=282685 RepID=A0ABW6S3Y9_9NOCA
MNQLDGVYGDGSTSSPSTGSVQNQVDTSGSGSGMSALKATQEYQQHAGTAYNNLDTELASFLQYLAGNQSVDRDALSQVINNTNSQLAQLGSAAYTRDGEVKVHQILVSALTNALKIVGNSNVNANAVAVEINRLTDQFLYNLVGVDYPAAEGISGASTGSSSAAQKAISVALSEQGKPYVYGAEGPYAFDCSGLTQYAAASAGAQIPRTAAQQYQQLPKVNSADIQPGDLIFPAAEFNNGSPGHVMMYIGNGQCIEAPHTGATVRVVNLPNSFAASRWT